MTQKSPNARFGWFRPVATIPRTNPLPTIGPPLFGPSPPPCWAPAPTFSGFGPLPLRAPTPSGLCTFGPLPIWAQNLRAPPVGPPPPRFLGLGLHPFGHPARPPTFSGFGPLPRHQSQLIFVFMHFFTDVSFVFVFQRSDTCSILLDAICHNVARFPTAPADSGLTIATFLLPCSSVLVSGLGPLSLSSRIRSFFTFAAVEVFLHTPTATLSSVPSTTVCTASSDVFRTLLRVFPRHRLLRPCQSPSVRSCQCSSHWVLKNNFFPVVMLCHGVDGSANSRASTCSLVESSFVSDFT